MRTMVEAKGRRRNGAQPDFEIAGECATADLIVVLDGARLVEVGRHELMAKDGRYSEPQCIQGCLPLITIAVDFLPS